LGWGWVYAAALLLLPTTAQAALPIQNWTTTGGARVLFVESHDLPMVDVSVEFPAGSGRDAAETSGLAGLTAQMLDRGASGKSEADIARGFADVGAVLSGSFDRDRAGARLRTLSSARELDQASALLAQVLQAPDFPLDVIEREKSRLVAALREAQALPATQADEAFWRGVYGDHPYALPESGTVATVEKLTREQIQNFYRDHYRAKGAVIAIMGDLDRAGAEKLAEQLAGGLAPGCGKLGPLPPVNPSQASEQRIPHHATQSHILIGQPGIKRGDADFYPLYVGNYVLGGGGFDSRILEEVRNKHGYAYSAYSYFAPMEQPGPWLAGLQTKREQADAALAVVRDTVRRFLDEGPSEEELTQAKNNIIGSFPLRIDSNKELLEYLAVIGYYRMPLTYLDDFPREVEKVTVAAIRDAFKRRVNPAEFVTVVVAGGAPN
jgi:zinc protease